MIIALVGKAGHGKDTVADMIIEEYSKHHTVVDSASKLSRKEGYRPFEKRRFAEGVKTICSIITGYPRDMFYNRGYYSAKVSALDITVRELMQKVGDGLRNTVHPDIWVQSALSKVGKNSNILFVDTRYPNEIEGIRKVGGKIIHIVRPDYVDPSLENEEQRNHKSETALNGYSIQPDLVIFNEGNLDALRKTVKIIIEEHILKWEHNSNLDNQSPKEEIQ